METRSQSTKVAIDVVATASTNLYDPVFFPNSCGRQSLPVAVIALGHNHLGNHLDEQRLDGVLHDGDRMFSAIQEEGRVELEDVPLNVTVDLSTLKVTQKKTVLEGHYSKPSLGDAHTFLKTKLNKIIGKSPITSCFLFQGNTHWTPFWTLGGLYRAVDLRSTQSPCTVVQCSNLDSLVHILLQDAKEGPPTSFQVVRLHFQVLHAPLRRKPKPRFNPNLPGTSKGHHEQVPTEEGGNTQASTQEQNTDQRRTKGDVHTQALTMEELQEEIEQLSDSNTSCTTCTDCDQGDSRRKRRLVRVKPGSPLKKPKNVPPKRTRLPTRRERLDTPPVPAKRVCHPSCDLGSPDRDSSPSMASGYGAESDSSMAGTPTPRGPGRPKTSALSRAEQLKLARQKYRLKKKQEKVNPKEPTTHLPQTLVVTPRTTRNQPTPTYAELASESSDEDVPLAQLRTRGTQSSQTDASLDSPDDVPLALRGRPKTRITPRKGQLNKNTKKYRETHPDRRRDSQNTYNASTPIPHRTAAGTYNKRHPEVNRDTSRVYSQNHPEVNRDAVRRYTQEHPEVHLEAVRRHTQEHPEGHREAVRRYDEQHPENVRERQQNYIRNNPNAGEARRAAQARYRAAHPEVSELRHLSKDMKRNVMDHGPAGFWDGDRLNLIQRHRLKKINLYSNDIYKCNHCGAHLFEEERHKEKWCCGLGRYNVLKDRLPPLTEDFYEHPAFLDRARAYNDLFAFCAMGVSGGYVHPTGISFLKIQGRMYHKVYNINARGQSFNLGNEYQYINHCRLYLDDGEERLNLAEGRRLSTVIIDAARSFLLANNPIAQQFRMLADEPSLHARLEFEQTSRATHGPVLGDPNPGAEVHAVLSVDENSSGGPRKLSVWKEGDERPSYIDVMSPLMEPFQFPLLYPQGTRGWHIGKLDNNGGKLSQYKYTRCLLLSEPRFNCLGRLSQAWQVEMYARFEEERLRYITRCQRGTNDPNAPRGAPLDELQAHVDAADRRRVRGDIAEDETVMGEGGAVPGKIYLPKTFVGSQRYYKEQYLNSVGLLNKKGSVSYFCTFTASGQWEELKASTRHGSKCDSATVCRIFHIKLQELLRDLRSGAVFGKPAYIIYCIEQQMRGMPHAHIALRVEDGGPTQGRDIDKVVRADIPGPQEAGGRLRQLVLKHMIHGPCGPQVRRNPKCWDDKKQLCTKYFPKAHNETTHTDEKGFVLYKRNTQNKAIIPNTTKETHDGWVVPYNPYLLLRYDCHINLEIATTRKVLKYLFLYMNKGNSKQNVRVVPLHEQSDEPEEYVTKRMLGASDACWRLLGYDLTHSEPSCCMLPVHLPGQQFVSFRAGGEAQAAENATSKLLLYMGRPLDPIFDQVTYQQFFEDFIVHTQHPERGQVFLHTDGKHFITRRQRKEKITRLFWVSPNRGELYYLRLLLLSVPCRGFPDLVARGGPDCTTFQEAARNLGLIDNEREYFEALAEAATFMTGPQLRSFFVVLCNIGAPAALLWEAHKHHLAEDFLHRFPGEEERAYKLALIQIDRALRRNGSRLADQGLPDVQDDSSELGRQRLQFGSAAQAEFVREWEPRLTGEQRSVLEHVRRLVETEHLPHAPDRRNILFLDGPGGFGKTQLLKVLTSYVRSQDKVALCVASSGIAALNMEGGSTAHSMFKLPLDLGNGVGTWNVRNTTQRADLIRAASLIIFDEAPMGHRHIFEMLDRSLRDLMGNDLPFGGKIFLCSGDFRQIAPVVERSRTPLDIVSVSLKASELWPLFTSFRLTVPQRTVGDAEYSDFLLSVGNGTLPEELVGPDDQKESLVPLPGISHDTDLDDLISNIYPDDILQNPDEAAKRAILATLNTNVREINDKILEQVHGPVHELRSFDGVDKETDDGLEVDEDTLHQARGKGVPDHVLRLKVGAVCLVTRNLNIESGLVNGTKVIVESVSLRLVRVRKPGTNVTYAIPRIIFKFPVVSGSPLVMTRRQFPLQVAYAMSFHKSQGQTIDKVGVDLRTDCFTHGQLYVGLSRVRASAHIRVLVQGDRVHNGIPYTKNIVYRLLLQ